MTDRERQNAASRRRNVRPERIAYMKAYRLAHPKDRRAYKAAYDATHKEEQAAWRAAIASDYVLRKKRIISVIVNGLSRTKKLVLWQIQKRCQFITHNITRLILIGLRPMSLLIEKCIPKRRLIAKIAGVLGNLRMVVRIHWGSAKNYSPCLGMFVFIAVGQIG